MRAATSTLLVRLSGEISTKARGTRLHFTRRLAANLRAALAAAGSRARVDRQWSRLFVEPAGEVELAVAARVFGVQSASLVERRPWSDLGELVACGERLYGEAVHGRTFAVRARRSGDPARIPFRSIDLERALGTVLLGRARAVDLETPEVTVQIEVHPDVAYFFHEKVAGPGGLPIGVEGRALALVSGGFDSAVASWLMLKRGVGLDYLFFNLGGTPHEHGVLRVLEIIARRWSQGDRPRLWAIDLRPAVEDLQRRVRPRFWQVVLKRVMLRTASRVAGELGHLALVTGEAVGQVSSQTLQNLAVIAGASDRLVLRPLVGCNKEEIVARARAIGTFELSAAVDEYCAILPRHPETRARAEAVAAEEAKLDPQPLATALAGRRSFDLLALGPADLESSDLEAEEIPAGAGLLDLRSPAAFRAWHLPGAERRDFLELLASFAELPRDRPWILYCEVGLKSAHLAAKMREAGFDARHLGGGAVALLERQRREDPAAAALLAPALRED